MTENQATESKGKGGKKGGREEGRRRCEKLIEDLVCWLCQAEAQVASLLPSIWNQSGSVGALSDIVWWDDAAKNLQMVELRVPFETVFRLPQRGRKPTMRTWLTELSRQATTPTISGKILRLLFVKRLKVGRIVQSG